MTDKFSFRRRIPFLSSLAVRIKTYFDTCDGTVVPPHYVFRIRNKVLFRFKFFYSDIITLSFLFDKHCLIME